MNQIGIVVALPNELRTLTKLSVDTGCWKAISDRILISVSGAGSRQAESAARMLVENGVESLISWGCAGALNEKLKAGDLVLPEEIISSDGTVFKSSADWRLQIRQLNSSQIGQVNSGRLVETKQIAATCLEKKTLAEKFHAIAVDMESAAIARVASKRRIPFIAVRAIVDPLSMVLPSAVAHSVDHRGKVDVSRLIGHLVLHPWEIAPLLRLGLQFRAAQKTLTRFAVLFKQDLNASFKGYQSWVSS